MSLVAKKFISLCLSLAFLANQGLPLYAGQTKKSSSGKKNTSAQQKSSAQKKASTKKKSTASQKKDNSGGLSAQVRKQVDQAQQKQPDYWVQQGAALAKANCYGVDCVLGILEKAANAEDPTQEQVCLSASGRAVNNDMVCMDATAFAQGALHMIVSSASTKDPWLYSDRKTERTWGSDKEYNVKTDWYPLKGEAAKMLQLIAQWGAYYDSDIIGLGKYFRSVALPSTCGKKEKSRGPGKSTNYCSEEMAALMGLALLAHAELKDKKIKFSSKMVRETANEVLTKKWNSDDKNMVVQGAIIALVTLNSTNAWKDIETFLAKTSKSKIGLANIIPSVEGLVGLGLVVANEAGEPQAFRYYNSVNKDFSYLDTLAAQEQGYKYPYNNPAFQYPNANTFEDVGFVIGKRAAEGNADARTLAKNIMKEVNTYQKARTAPRKVQPQRITTTSGAVAPAAPAPDTRWAVSYEGHWPVVIGILKGATGNPRSIIPDGMSAESFYNLVRGIFVKEDMWDLNAGTEIHVTNIAVDYMNALSGKKERRLSTETKQFQVAKERYKTVMGWKDAGQYADMAIILFSAPSMVVSLPALGRSIYTASSYLVSRGKFLGKGAATLFKKSSSVAKTGKGVAKVEKTTVTAARTEKTATRAGKGTKTSKTSRGSQSAAKPAEPGKTGKTSKTGRGEASKPDESGSTGKPVAKPSQQGTEPTPRTGNNPAQAEENVTGPLDQQVQQAKAGASQPQTAAERLGNPTAPKPDLSPSAKPSAMQRVKGEAEDIKKAFSRWWDQQAAQAQKVGIMPGKPQINPFAGLGDAYKAVKAERKTASAIGPSNLIKAESLDSSHRMAYFIKEDGSVAKQIISEKEYGQIVASASEADTRAWATRSFKYRKEMFALDHPNPGIEIIRQTPKRPVAKTNVAPEEAGLREVRLGERGETTAQTARESAAAERAAAESATAEQTARGRSVAGRAASDNVSRLSSQMKGDRKKVFDSISENLNEVSNLPLTAAQRARVEEAERYFSQLTLEQVNDWNALQSSAEFQKHSILLRSPAATEHAFYVEGAGLEPYFTSSFGARQAKGFIPTIVGEPKGGFARSDLQKAFRVAERTDKPILVKITAHGEIDSAGHFYFPSRGLNNSTRVNTSELVDDLQQLRRTTGTPEVNLQLDACHSGQFMQEFEALPKVKREGINVYVHAGGRQQENLVGAMAGKAAGRGSAERSIAVHQIDVLTEQIGKGNVYVRGYLQGEPFNPLEQALWRARSEGSPLAEEIEALYDIQNASSAEINGAMARYQKIKSTSRFGVSRGSNFTEESARVFGDARRYIEETATKMANGQRWQQSVGSSGGIFARFFGRKKP